ncbi:MAG: glycosyl transferase [Bacteroidetes bacterium]|uniref:Glycosyl transferase n=1 Tax=Candidatus Cryptobacteroides excrementavium TaxID=2840759 RepID=A0A9D9J0S9_9BACT|nr:glycosyl transferase [Candidatus Cryptobacteroides excrementavium]
MIPKIIHYCWFGRKQKNELAVKCIASWKEILPDYTLMEWNETNFDYKKLKFTKQAYHIGKYAFVADVARLYALANFGGIYLDTDVEVLKSFDELLYLPAFIGYEHSCPTREEIGTAVIGAGKGNSIITEFLNYYDRQVFILDNGEYNTTPNVAIITKLLSQKGISLNNQYYNYNNTLSIFPVDYFSPKNYTGATLITDRTFCIHHFSASWCRQIPAKHRWIVNIIGEDNYFRLGKIRNKLLKNLIHH